MTRSILRSHGRLCRFCRISGERSAHETGLAWIGASGALAGEVTGKALLTAGGEGATGHNRKERRSGANQSEAGGRVSGQVSDLNN
jgi:hypothetical protein